MSRISPPWRRVTDEQAADALRTLKAMAEGVPTSKSAALRAVRTMAKFEREQQFAAKEKAKKRRPTTFSAPPPGHRGIG
jgi:hypothetical protein